MIKVWFLMALMAFPTSPVIFYKGFAAYETLEVCESKKIPVENLIMKTEIDRKRVVYVETFCMEMHVFPRQFDEFNKLKEDLLNPKT